MVFQYKPISKSKYKYISTLRWFQANSHSPKVTLQTLPNEVAQDRKVLKRTQNLSAENQQYLIKRSKTDYSA